MQFFRRNANILALASQMEAVAQSKEAERDVAPVPVGTISSTGCQL